MSRLTDGIAENTHIEEDDVLMGSALDTAEEESTVIDNVTDDEDDSAEEEQKQTDVQVLPNNVISLDMREASRTKIWVNGDATKVLELNLTDVGILSRFSDAYPKLLSLQDDINSTIAESQPENFENIEELSNFAAQFKSVDKKMREYVDYIFDFKVCDVCCDGGSMYDLVAGGWWRFEYIIEKLGSLYNMKFGEEMKKNAKRMKMHTERYTGKSKYTKKRNTRK